MSLAIGKLFHRKHNEPEALTVPQVLDDWPRAPSGICDLCAVPLEAASHLVPAGEFQVAVRGGYDPVARGRVRDQADSPTGDAAERYRTWRAAAEGTPSDWSLCRRCAVDVAAFLAEEPS
jgi:hypothetical protein